MNLLTHFFFLSFTLAQFLQTNSLQFGVGGDAHSRSANGKSALDTNSQLILSFSSSLNPITIIQTHVCLTGQHAEEEEDV